MWWICTDKTMSMKRHYISASLCNLLIEDMESRGDGFILDEGRSTFESKIYFEIGGMGLLFVGQPSMTFDVFGKALSIDCMDIPVWIAKITSSKRRKFSEGTEYIKLYSRFCCLILSIPEKESLLFQLRGKEKEAKRKCDSYFTGVRGHYKKMEDGIYIRGEKIPSKEVPSIDVQELKGISLFKVDDDEPKE